MPSSILVVEDEPAISELISVNNSSTRGTVQSARTTPNEAQSLISDVLPDLVLLDWMLPGKSGINFARFAPPERMKHIPICHRADRTWR